MQRYPGQRHRFPKKRNIIRVLLIIALPVLLIFLLLGSAAILSDNQTEETFTTDADIPPDDIPELSVSEAYPQGLLPESLTFDRLFLEKGKRRLTAYNKGKPVRVYLVALGANPVGHKEVEGDKRTPEGKYAIDGKNPNSAYHKNLGISYPDSRDKAHARSLGKSPGGDIKIHGLAPEYAWIGSAHRFTDWTYGCIAVTNDEMDELYKRTPVGTLIEIVP